MVAPEKVIHSFIQVPEETCFDALDVDIFRDRKYIHTLLLPGLGWKQEVGGRQDCDPSELSLFLHSTLEGNQVDGL